MYVASKHSRMKIFHKEDCHYAKRIHDNNELHFRSIDQAELCGYCYCLYCAPIMKYYRRERKESDSLCRENGVLVQLNDDGTMEVKSKRDQWKIDLDEKNALLVLYHKNTVDTTELSAVFQGYHNQDVRKKSMKQIVKYIIKHDKYRKKHPVAVHEPPKKGTRNYQKQKRSYDHWKKQQEKWMSYHRVYKLMKKI